MGLMARNTQTRTDPRVSQPATQAWARLWARRGWWLFPLVTAVAALLVLFGLARFTGSADYLQF